ALGRSARRSLSGRPPTQSKKDAPEDVEPDWEIAMPSYDPNNIFAKILRGELPCHKVYEDDRAFAFLDIMPRAPGHTLVIPKAPARNILDVKPDDLAHVMAVAQKIAQTVIKVFSADGVTIQQFNEPSGGQVVFHLHVH